VIPCLLKEEVYFYRVERH